MSLDQFYTCPELAKELSDILKAEVPVGAVIEPSAGVGAFSDNFEGCTKVDLDPQDDETIKADYMEFDKDLSGFTVVGNPPFGKNCSLAMKFFKRSMELGANTVAFLVPTAFEKVGKQSFRDFPPEWKLVRIVNCGNAKFIRPDGKVERKPTSFVIWTKLDGFEDTRKKILDQPKEFDFLTNGKWENNAKASFCFNGNSGKVHDPSETTNVYSAQPIVAHEPWVRDVFETMKPERLPTVSINHCWIGRQEIIAAFNEEKKRRGL